MSIIFLAFGSNLGDREANLREAQAALPPHVLPLAASAVYETPPWGYSDQPAFLNSVIKAETALPPADLLKFVKDLEANLGRQASFRYGPRKIDIDILFYDDLQLDTPELTIPHPRLAERAFVLVPLLDIAPDLVHPALGLTVRELVNQVDAAGIHRLGG